MIVTPYYISAEQFNGALNSGNRVFLLDDPTIKLLYTVSEGARQQGHNSYVSSNHCQYGSDIIVHTLYVCRDDKCPNNDDKLKYDNNKKRLSYK